MSVLNRYVYNQAYPEGSVIEGYSTEEVIECYQEYLKGQKGIGKPDSCHKGKLAGKGTRGQKVMPVSLPIGFHARGHAGILCPLPSLIMEPSGYAQLCTYRLRTDINRS